MMVEIFKTNISENGEAAKVISMLQHELPGYRINFDLADADNILRVEAVSVCQATIVHLLQCRGYQCEIIE